jgi:hypothetical protein
MRKVVIASDPKDCPIKLSDVRVGSAFYNINEEDETSLCFKVLSTEKVNGQLTLEGKILTKGKDFGEIVKQGDKFEFDCHVVGGYVKDLYEY